MGRNSQNWIHKDQNAINAKSWVRSCEEKFPTFIKASIEKSKIYGEGKIPQNIEGKDDISTEIVYLNMDTVSAIKEVWCKDQDVYKIAALNFASYKNPGGGYLDGATAQEECLCSESTLFNVIAPFYDVFYKPHLKKLNGGLYGDDLIYSPGILFFRDGKQMIADVITCAAPNYYSIKKYNRCSYEDVIHAMVSRIDHILYAVYKEDAKVVILGAFGCGVFMNDPVIVSQIFHYFLKTKYDGCFMEAIFAVPTFRNEKTFQVFKESGEKMIQFLETEGNVVHGQAPELIKYMI